MEDGVNSTNWCVFVVATGLFFAAGACEKKSEVPDAAPAESTGAASTEAEQADQNATTDAEAGDEETYDELAEQYEQLAEQYEQREAQLPQGMRGLGPRMHEMRGQMGYMHQLRARERGPRQGQHGKQHRMRRRQHHRAQTGAHGNCGPQTMCWASGIDEWHTQMAQMHRQMAATHAEAGMQDLAERHEQLAERHTQIANQLEASAEGEAQPPRTAGAEQPDGGTALAAAEGETLYMSACAMCHGEQGQGVSGAFPPLAQSEYVTGPKDRLIELTLHGMSGPIEVRGEKYDSFMPSFRARFSDEELAGILSYIRTSWGNDASAVTAPEVARGRKRSE
ncbi:cytochrome c [Persicimonas caeni]|uniref:Cytochrome c n=1 Tax=Persicimonas caeni TaxID=2292766 RepID=A0A4Y6PXF8_PERCE|nr:cytochrome c [Persicimonas caeni]QED34218.1 cytochrome c [Persicimonas caeni]